MSRVTCVMCVLAIAAGFAQSNSRSDYSEAFDEIHRTVEEHFFDPTLNGLDWDALGGEYRERVAKVATLNDFSAIVNEMLGLLDASHTTLLTALDPEFYQLRGIFNQPGTRFPGIGIFTAEIDGETFISGVLENSPAWRAGLRVGDRIVSVNDKPFQPIGSFEDRVGRTTPMTVQRTREPDSVVTVQVVPEVFSTVDLFVEAIRSSARVIETERMNIGYIRMWTFAGHPYREALRRAVTEAPLRDADALIIDLRDGWGGANPDDINLFSERVPILTFIPRDGEPNTIDSVWRKPVALLVNKGTRSGKEILAYSFQKHRIGPVIGQTTAGAVLGGRLFSIRDDMLLYLAVLDIRVDGERLEGAGVVPDIQVEFDLPYADGADLQLEAAINALANRAP